MTSSKHPTFELGIGLGTTDPDQLRRCVAIADEGGIGFLSVGDNPGNLLETYVSLTLLAVTSTTTRVGTAMTNPISRDPLVVASALSSLDRMVPGRVFLGISTGRSRLTARVDELRGFLDALRDLWRTGHAVHCGRSYELTWDARPVPIIVGAAGPRTLQLAGELADGVIVETGVTPEDIDDATSHIERGARSAGRDVTDLELWWYLKSALGDTSELATEHALAGLAASAALVLGHDPVGRRVPPEFQEACLRARARYDLSAHVRTEGPDPNRELVRDDAFRAYLVDRYGLVGTQEEWRARIRELRGRGVDRVFCAAVVPDREYFVRGAAAVLASL